jgi:hypothetical protein
MNMPGFTAEVSLYRTKESYQGVVRTPTNRLAAPSIVPAAIFAPLTCYIDGSEAPCDLALGCYFAGFCELAPDPFVVTTKTRSRRG